VKEKKLKVVMEIKRKINITVIINWDNYDDVCDELILEDTGIYDSLKKGVEIKLDKSINSKKKRKK